MPTFGDSFDPRTKAIVPQDIIYKAAALVGNTTMTASLRAQAAGLIELAGVYLSITDAPGPKPSEATPDALLRFVGNANGNGRPSQGTITFTGLGVTTTGVTIDDGTNAAIEYNFTSGGDVQVAVGASAADSCKNLASAINVSTLAGDLTVRAVYVGELFGASTESMILVHSLAAQWADNAAMVEDLVNATATGLQFGVAIT